ncbi:MAG: hypothetical protein GX896_07325 [Clostridiales bacterium]|nr:hypothetical protein [Clostridiales bacterium]
MIEFEVFKEMNHDEILEILIEHLDEWKYKAEKNRRKLSIDSRSMTLKNRGREIGAALTAIINLIEDLGIDVSEL